MSDEQGPAGPSQQDEPKDEVEGHGKHAIARARWTSEDRRPARSTRATRSRRTAHHTRWPTRWTEQPLRAAEEPGQPGFFVVLNPGSSRSSARRSWSPAARCSSSASSRREAKRASVAELAVARKRGLGAPRPPQQLERDRGLVREEAEQVHLGERERRRPRAGRAPRARRARRPRRGAEPPSARAARSRSTRPRRARTACPSSGRRRRAAGASRAPSPATPVLEGKRRPSSVPEPSPATASKTSSSASSSSSRTDAAFAWKMPRAVSTVACSSARNASSAPSDARRNRCAQIAHAPPPTFVEVWCSTLFS